MATWLLVVALLLSLVVLLRNASRRRSLPPGPPAVPMLGNLLFLWLWLRTSAADRKPLILGLIKKYGPIVTLSLGSRIFIVVADRQLAHEALTRTGVALADRPQTAMSKFVGGSDKVITRANYGPVLRLLRRNLVSETLHPSRVGLFAPARASVRCVLMEKLREEDKPNVMEKFQYTMFYLLVLMCFGERLDEPAVRAIEDALRAWLHHDSSKMTVFLYFPSIIAKHLFHGRLQAAHALHCRWKELFVPLIDARRQYKSQGETPTRRDTTTFHHSYVDTLLDIQLPDEGNRALTEDEIIELCSEFLLAGTDTTSTGLQWIMAELVKKPSVQEKLYNEIESTCGDDEGVSEEHLQKMPYLKAVIQEGLRKNPPTHFVLPHKAAEDIAIGGYQIPKGAEVNFMVAEMGRDEKEWEQAMEFVPERFLEGGNFTSVDLYGTKGIRMMPFGVGRRICPAISIAILHLQYFVANMVKEFEWKDVAGNEVDFAEKFQLTTFMAKPLRPQLVPRRNKRKEKNNSQGAVGPWASSLRC